MVFRIVAALTLVFAVTSPAHAETYLAGQVGGNFPQRLSQVEWSAAGTTVRSNDFSLSQSGAYGLKVGYYLKEFKWVGVESDLYYSTPSLKQQNLTVAGVNFGTAQGVKHPLTAPPPHQASGRTRRPTLSDRAALPRGDRPRPSRIRPDAAESADPRAPRSCSIATASAFAAGSAIRAHTGPGSGHTSPVPR